MISMEKARRLHGAVSLEERRKKLGQYYTITWSDPSIRQGPAKLVFLYQQGATASLVKKAERTFLPSAIEGRGEFTVIGDDYFKGGKVLAWKVTLSRGGKEIASEQSYLWR